MEVYDLITELDWGKFQAGIRLSVPTDVAEHIIKSVDKLRGDYVTLRTNCTLFAVQHMTDADFSRALSDVAADLAPNGQESAEASESEGQGEYQSK